MAVSDSDEPTMKSPEFCRYVSGTTFNDAPWNSFVWVFFSWLHFVSDEIPDIFFLVYRIRIEVACILYFFWGRTRYLKFRAWPNMAEPSPNKLHQMVDPLHIHDVLCGSYNKWIYLFFASFYESIQKYSTCATFKSQYLHYHRLSIWNDILLAQKSTHHPDSAPGQERLSTHSQLLYQTSACPRCVSPSLEFGGVWQVPSE